jgi:hypothetical protein
MAVLAAGKAQAAGVPGQGTWEMTLQPRELDGNAANGPEAFYDTVLDITWLRNANLNGLMNWGTAKTWADNLVVGSVGGWRLPKVVDTGAPGCDWSYGGGTDCGYNVDTATGEMAHLYYLTLGNKGYYDTSGGGAQPGWGLTNTGGFQNLQSKNYWSGTEYAPDPSDAWYFNTHGGSQDFDGLNLALYAMAVRPGDVAAVPEPQTYAMLLLGLSAVMVAVRPRPH